MASRDPLIRHAITPPAFDPRNDVHRERLVDAIHANIPRKLIAIGAPAGYGKTTLLADFGEHTDLTVCWMRLTEADWDVMRFANVLAASLQNRFRRLKGQPNLKVLATSSPEALAIAFAAAIDEHIGETFIIALDNVDLINQSKPVLALLDRLLLELPEQVTVIAAGREVLETSVLAQLMAEGDLAGFGPHDLALTREELVELSGLMQGQALPGDEIDRLLEESRGWVTAIVMSGRVADLNSGTLFGGGRPMVYEFLASVVLNRQPDDLRRFALDASILPVMTSSTCDQVLDRDDSRKYLGQLEGKGLFVTSSQTTPKTYEFHPLFREFLLESLESADPRRMAALRRSAADYYVDGQAPELAVDLLIDAGSISRAAKLAESSSKALYDGGRVQTLDRWAERFRPHNAAVPSILIWLALFSGDRGKLETAEQLLDEAGSYVSNKSPKGLQALFQVAFGITNLRQGRFDETMRAAKRIESLFAKRANRRYLGLASRLRGLILLHSGTQIELAQELLTEAAEALTAPEDRYTRLATLVDLANAHYHLGESPEERQVRNKVLRLARSIGAPLPLAVAIGNSALGAYEQGDYQQALNLSQEGLKYARQAASPLREAINLLRQADTFSDLGLVLQAAEIYDQALTILMDLDADSWVRYCCIRISTLHRRHGSLSTAREWLKRALLLDEQESQSAELRIELAAVEAGPSPEKSTKILRSLLRLRKARLDSRMKTLAHYFLGWAALLADDTDRARKQLQLTMELVGKYQTAQYIAAELLTADQAAEFLRREFPSDPTAKVIFNQMETMRAFARRFAAPPDEQAQADAVRIQVQALGRTQVMVNGVENLQLKPLTREVLSRLLDSALVGKEELAKQFWPELPDGRRAASLHTAISSIRREFGKEAIQLDGSLYRLDPSLPIEYDVHRFEQAIAVVDRLPPGDPRVGFALTEARSLYGGPFLPDSQSEWADLRRRELELEFLEVLASIGYEAIVSDQPMRAIGVLKEALEIDPYRDDLNFNYLDALGRLGRRSDAVAHYQAYVRLLSTELGLDPPDETRELYTRLIT